MVLHEPTRHCRPNLGARSCCVDEVAARHVDADCLVRLHVMPFGAPERAAALQQVGHLAGVRPPALPGRRRCTLAPRVCPV